MMKKKLTKITAAAVAAGIGVISIGFPVKADMNIGSKGNIVLGDGEMAVYAADVDYLQSEIDNLYNEIPAEDRNPSGSGDIDFIRKNRIQSKGIIDYAGGTVVIDSSDFIQMANEIDELEYTYKQIILKYLNGINTYLASDGSVTHDETDNDITHFPTFDELITGISLSQEVETGTTIDNLSKDKGAWVNGEYITGNGNDVNAAYSQGYADGVNYATGHANISYVYHQHTGSQSGAGSGCYQGYHVHTSSCPTSSVVTGTTQCGWNITASGPCIHHGTSMGYTVDMGGGRTATVCGGMLDVYGTSYTCNNSPCNNWKIVCGKTTSTIESATITFK